MLIAPIPRADAISQTPEATPREGVRERRPVPDRGGRRKRQKPEDQGKRQTVSRKGHIDTTA